MTAFLRQQLPSLLILILLSGAGFWLLQSGKQVPPALSLSFSDGHQATLASYRGKPLVIHFWAPDCGVCVQDIPRLARLYPELKRQNAELIGIELSTRSTTKAGMPTGALKQPYPMATATKGKRDPAIDDIEPSTTLLIDSNGQVAERLHGPLDPVRILAWLATQ